MFILVVKNQITDFADVQMLNAKMVRASESLMWRKPRQFANSALADLTISYFADCVSEATLKYFASMEKRHGDKTKRVVSSIYLFHSFCLS